MPSPPTTLTSVLLFLAFTLSLLLLFLLSRFYKYWRRRPTRIIEPEDETTALSVAPLRWEAAPPSQEGGDEMGAAAGWEEGEGEQQKRRKKRGKKKRQEPPRGALEDAEDGADDKLGGGKQRGGNRTNGASYPFSSFASATQRKIKLQYDQLVTSNQPKALTVDQVSQFINCLVEARNELQHKSEIIQRSFKIKKALLFKADNSSFDRLCQQIYKLQAEHKRLEKDAAVYNLLQEQLKLSPAYKTMREIGANMEQKSELDQTTEFADISFEELLAQEKKDSFWQRYGKLRSSAS